MAGGRRPASYVAARHNTGVERSACDCPTSPTVGSAAAASLPLWIPSIWQPSPTTPTASPEPIPLHPPRRDRLPRPDPSSALAAALDSAVQSAVVRALGYSAPPTSPHVRTASSLSESGVEDEVAAGAARERELTNVVDALQHRLDEKNDDVTKLTDRLKALECKVDMQAEAHAREGRAMAELSAHVRNFATQVGESDEVTEGKIAAVQEQVKRNQAALAKVRTGQKGVEAELRAFNKWRGDMTGEMRRMELSVSAEFEKHSCHMEEIGRRVDGMAERGEGAGWEREIEEVRRGLQATTESAAASKSKLKRVEMQVAESLKQADDMVALNSGFEEGIRDSLLKVTNMIDGLGSSVEQLRNDITARGKVEDESDVFSRLGRVECNVKSLKKLIESNLRTQWNAESIVKEQVSLITKHVCVAMRQYTTRRISENNALIDQTLRARVPEYAKNEGQFVLVREEDTDGNESIDIQRSSEVSSDNSS